MYFRCKCILVHTQTNVLSFFSVFWSKSAYCMQHDVNVFLGQIKGTLKFLGIKPENNIANTENIYKSSLKQQMYVFSFLYKDKRL